jgi:hypothetical protein
MERLKVMKSFPRFLFSFLCIFSFSFASGIETQFDIENTNIIIKKEHDDSVDYNRLRIYGTLESENFEDFLFHFILDNENNYNLSKNNNENKSKIYRAYLKYVDSKNLVVIGKQRVPFGVGKIWNPIDIFNPIVATSIESDERKGTDAIRYEYAINSLSTLDMTLSEEKFATRVKGYLEFADMALVFVKDEDKKRDIYAYEIQGELFESGVELRSEGGYFFPQYEKEYFEGIFGAEYGLENSLTFLGEYKYNSDTNINYLASSLSYTFTPLVTGSFLVIKNLKDKSIFYSPRFEYSLSDESILSIGANLNSDKNSLKEFNKDSNSFFLRFFINF